MNGRAKWETSLYSSFIIHHSAFQGGQHRPALLTVEKLEDVFKVLREVTQHILGCLLRIVGPENEGRQLTTLAMKGLPQFSLALRAVLTFAGWHWTLFARFV